MYHKNKMKKKISLYMALILLINLVIPAAFPAYEAKAAAALVLSANNEFKEFLTLGTNKATPDRVSNTGAVIPLDQTCLSWNLDAIQGLTSFTEGTYVLRYYKADGKKVELTLRMTMNNIMMVNYDVFTTNGAVSPNKFININDPSLGPFTAGTLNYGVHSPLDQTQTYVPVASYLIKNFNGGYDDPINNTILPIRVNNRDPYDANYPNNLNDTVDNTTAPPSYHYSTWVFRLAPSFNITAGSGYSFTYDGVKVSFLWDASQNKNMFYFNTDSLQQGFIYDFQLEYYTKNMTYSLSEQLNKQNKDAAALSNVAYGVHAIFTGINTKTVAVTPFAATTSSAGLLVDNTIADYRKETNTYDNDPMVNYDIGDIAMPNANGDKPALPSNGLDIRFDLPKNYDENTNAFSGNPASPMTMLLELQHADSRFTTGVEINDVYNKLDRRVDTSTNYSANTNVKFKKDPNNQASLTDASLLTKTGASDYYRVRMRLDNIDPGLIFSSLLVTVMPKTVDNTVWSSRDTTVSGDTRMHTFLDYNIFSLNGKNYITVTPFGMNANVRLKGWYRLMAGASLTETVRVPSDGTSIVQIPITAGTTSLLSTRYQVQFSVSGNFSQGATYYSQIIYYTPEPLTPSVGTPDNFTILQPKLTAVSGYENTNVADLTFETQWDLGNEESLAKLAAKATDGKLKITYDLNEAFVPSKDDASYSLFNRIEVTVSPSTLTTTSGSALQVEYAIVSADPANPNLSKAEIVNVGAQPLSIRVDKSTVPATNIAYADITFVAKTAQAEYAYFNTIAGFEHPDFRYPNVYFMNVKPVSMAQAGTGVTNLDAITASVFDTMTLSNLTTTPAPSPQNLKAAAQGDQPVIQVDYKIPGDGIKKYLDDRAVYPDTQITVDLYIGQSEPVIQSKFYPGGVSLTGLSARRLAADQTIAYDAAWAGTVDLSAYLDILRGDSAVFNSGVVCLRDIPILDGKGVPLDPTLNAKEISGILSGGTWPVMLTMTGLDANQQYYIFADLVITRRDAGGNILKFTDSQRDMVDASILTGLAGAITGAQINVPDLSEQVPPAPNVRVEKDSVNQTLATIYWDSIKPGNNETGVTIEYEIIRVKDRQLTDAELRMPEKDLLTYLTDDINNNDKSGWRTNGNGIDWYQYDQAAKSFSLVTNPSEELYKYNAKSAPLTFTDKTLLPNQLYFFYVRTVREVSVVDPQLGPTPKKTVSTWSAVSVTTKPVQSPFNLKVENNRTDYDRHTEVIFSFDVSNLVLANLGKEYSLQYQLKEDSGEWLDPKDMDPAQLSDAKNYTVSSDGKLMHFVYKQPGLTANKLYSLRVRIYDLTAQDGSLYSNIVQFKTEVNQEEYDDLHTIDSWLNFLRKQLQQLVTDPYWLARETTSELTVVYRPGDYFNAVLSASPDAALMLYNNNIDSAVYYIPVSALYAANSAGKGFRVQYNDFDMRLSPGFINPNYNDAVTTMAGYIKTKDISDYFVRISVQRSRVYGTVEGDTALGKQTNVSLELVGVVPGVTDIDTWDDDLFTQFAATLDAKINDAAVRAKLLEQIKNDTVSEDMVAYINELASGIKTDMSKLVYDQLRTTGSGILSTKSATVTKLDAPMTLIAGGLEQNASVNGYQLQNAVWMPRAVTDYYNGKGMSVATTGTFVFTGHTVNIPGVENVPGGGAIQALTAKYGLDDYLGRDSIKLNQNATRLMVAGCVARLAGAPKTADPITWIASNLNITLSSKNSAGNVQTQEALAMVMALYEKKTNTKISSMKIRNYAATAGMTDLDSRYAQAVRAAFEVGVASDTALKPTGAVTVGKLLDMLAVLDSKVKL